MKKLLSVPKVPADGPRAASPRPLLSDLLFGQDVLPEDQLDELDEVQRDLVDQPNSSSLTHFNPAIQDFASAQLYAPNSPPIK